MLLKLYNSVQNQYFTILSTIIIKEIIIINDNNNFFPIALMFETVEVSQTIHAMIRGK